MLFFLKRYFLLIKKQREASPKQRPPKKTKDQNQSVNIAQLLINRDDETKLIKTLHSNSKKRYVAQSNDIGKNNF